MAEVLDLVIEVDWAHGGVWSDVSGDLERVTIGYGSTGDVDPNAVRAASADGELRLYDEDGDYTNQTTSIYDLANPHPVRIRVGNFTLWQGVLEPGELKQRVGATRLARYRLRNVFPRDTRDWGNAIGGALILSAINFVNAVSQWGNPTQNHAWNKIAGIPTVQPVTDVSIDPIGELTFPQSLDIAAQLADGWSLQDRFGYIGVISAASVHVLETQSIDNQPVIQLDRRERVDQVRNHLILYDHKTIATKQGETEDTASITIYGDRVVEMPPWFDARTLPDTAWRQAVATRRAQPPVTAKLVMPLIDTMDLNIVHSDRVEFSGSEYLVLGRRIHREGRRLPLLTLNMVEVDSLSADTVWILGLSVLGTSTILAGEAQTYWVLGKSILGVDTILT